MGSKLSLSSGDVNVIGEILSYEFRGPFMEEGVNGLYFNSIYLPEEVVTLILSYINPKNILSASLVCKRWCNIVKSTRFWVGIYERNHGKQPEKLPWYVFYCYFSQKLLDHNLLKNGNGQEGYKYWETLHSGGNGFTIEQTPCGADPLPSDVPEFHGHTSCFATSYERCIKRQQINLFKISKLLYYIVNKFKPHIYMSEWVAGRFDCGCVYILTGLLGSKERIVHDQSSREFRVEQWHGKEWSKVKS